jgi:hypothetical protein
MFDSSNNVHLALETFSSWRTAGFNILSPNPITTYYDIKRTDAFTSRAISVVCGATESDVYFAGLIWNEGFLIWMRSIIKVDTSTNSNFWIISHSTDPYSSNFYFIRRIIYANLNGSPYLFYCSEGNYSPTSNVLIYVTALNPLNSNISPLGSDTLSFYY